MLVRFFFMYLLLCCSSGDALAQQTDTIPVLDEVQVIKYISRTHKEIIPVQTLAGKELERLSVYSVADALRYFSGLQIKDYGGIGGLKTVNVRSMGSQHLGVFYDGIQLGNAQNGMIDLGRFSLENMESISLYNGQKSAIFQPAKDFASAASIYLATRIPSFKDGKKRNLRASLKAGSFGTVNPAALWEQRISDSVSSSFNAEYMYTTGRYKFSYAKKDGYDTTEIRKNGDVSALRIEQGFFGKIPQGKWQAKAYYYHSQRGYPGAAVREDPGKFTHQDRQWDHNFFLQSSLLKGVGRRYEMLLNAKYAYNFLHYQSDPRLDVTTMYVDNRYRQQELYFSSANRLDITDWWSASLSADFQWNTLHADLYDFVYPRRYTGLAAAATSLQLTRFKLQASLLTTHVYEKTRVAGSAANDRQKYTPTIVASWQPFKKAGFNLRAFYKNIFRMPTLNDLYYTFIGNKNLNPEYAKQFNIGATYVKAFNSKWARLMEVQVDAYYNEVTDKIVAMPTSNQFRWTMVNLGLVQIRGLDAAITNTWITGKRWVLNSRLTYTYQKAQDFTNPSSSYYGDQIPYIPLHSGSIILGAIYKTWYFNYSFIYTGHRYNAGANIPENYEKPWYTNDFSVSKELDYKKKTIRLTAEINNIFNQQYEVVRSYPMPGTNVYFRINIKI